MIHAHTDTHRHRHTDTDTDTHTHTHTPTLHVSGTHNLQNLGEIFINRNYMYMHANAKYDYASSWGAFCALSVGEFGGSEILLMTEYASTDSKPVCMLIKYMGSSVFDYSTHARTIWTSAHFRESETRLRMLYIYIYIHTHTCMHRHEYVP
jgi:hypothetical protein